MRTAIPPTAHHEPVRHTFGYFFHSVQADTDIKSKAIWIVQIIFILFITTYTLFFFTPSPGEGCSLREIRRNYSLSSLLVNVSAPVGTTFLLVAASQKMIREDNMFHFTNSDNGGDKSTQRNLKSQRVEKDSNINQVPSSELVNCQEVINDTRQESVGKLCRPSYEYSALNTLVNTINSDVNVNVIGVVVSFSRPKPCRYGTNKYNASYTLVDQSCKDFNSAVVLNVFADDMNALPKVTAIGDVLRCNRVKVQLYGGCPQLVGNANNSVCRSAFVNFHKIKWSSTGLSRTLLPSTTFSNYPQYHKKSNNGTDIYCTSANGKKQYLPPLHEWDISSNSDHFSFTFADMDMILQLHEWSIEFLLRHSLSSPHTSRQASLLQLFNRATSIAAVHSATETVIECDVTCIVTACYPLDDINAPGSLILELWDGTTEGTLTSASTRGSQNFDDVNASVYSSTVYSSLNVFNNIESLKARLINSNDPPSQLLGSAVAIIVPFCAHSPPALPTFAPGTWLRIRNLDSLMSRSQQQLATGTVIVGVAKLVTHFNVLCPYFHDVTAVGSAYETRLSEYKAVRGCSSRIVSSDDNGTHTTQPQKSVGRSVSSAGIPYTLLVLCLATPAPAKFCVRAKIISYWPKNVSSFVSNVSSLNLKSSMKSMHIRESLITNDFFMFNLVIADNTAQYNMIAFGDDAQFFLGEILTIYY